MKVYDIEDVSREEFKEISTYFKFKEKITNFQNKVTHNDFKELFGEDSERLWSHFAHSTGAKVDVFVTYLTQAQKNRLYSTIFKNEEYE